MPEMSISTYLPADPEQVFSQVTAFPARGTPDTRALEEKYGQLEDQDGPSYQFREKSATGIRWRYTFDPPRQRYAEALESTWSDRTDTFEAEGDGTVWTITWHPKARGAPLLLRWLFFRLKDRKMLEERLMGPVVDHFQKREFY